MGGIVGKPKDIWAGFFDKAIQDGFRIQKEIFKLHAAGKLDPSNVSQVSNLIENGLDAAEEQKRTQHVKKLWQAYHVSNGENVMTEMEFQSLTMDSLSHLRTHFPQLIHELMDELGKYTKSLLSHLAMKSGSDTSTLDFAWLEQRLQKEESDIISGIQMEMDNIMNKKIFIIKLLWDKLADPSKGGIPHSSFLEKYYSVSHEVINPLFDGSEDHLSST